MKQHLIPVIISLVSRRIEITTFILAQLLNDKNTIKEEAQRKIEEIQKENEADNNQKTVPKSVFDRLKDLNLSFCNTNYL